MVQLLNNQKAKIYPNEIYFPLSLGFDSVAITQKKKVCQSRSDINIQSEIIKGVFRPVPLIASNMSTVCNAEFCILLYKLGALGVLHRAASDEVLIEETKKIAKECSEVAVSIGTNGRDKELAAKLIEAGANIIFIDVAHGYCDEVIDLGRYIKKEHRDIKVVVGNTVNANMLADVADFADALKVGIAQGLACETKNTAGCTEKQFSAVYKFKNWVQVYPVPIISDGGIREPADFVKAIGAGASSVMAGSIFARCPESAATIVESNGVKKKLYMGMASRPVQEQWKGELRNGCPEGGVRLLDLGESASDLINRYVGALRSGISYAGGSDLDSFKKSVEFIRIV